MTAKILDTLNSMGSMLGFPNFNSEYPSYVEKVFREKGVKGDALELRPINHDIGVNWSYEEGLDFTGLWENVKNLFDRTLLKSPVMQCKDRWGYKGLVLHIRGRENTDRKVYFLGKNALSLPKDEESSKGLFTTRKVHAGVELSFQNVEIICYIFRGISVLFTLNRASGECLQATTSLRTEKDEQDISQDDVTPLFWKGAHISTRLLFKLLTGTHDELQLGNDPSFKLFEKETAAAEEPLLVEKEEEVDSDEEG